MLCGRTVRARGSTTGGAARTAAKRGAQHASGLEPIASGGAPATTSPTHTSRGRSDDTDQPTCLHFEPTIDDDAPPNLCALVAGTRRALTSRTDDHSTQNGRARTTRRARCGKRDGPVSTHQSDEVDRSPHLNLGEIERGRALDAPTRKHRNLRLRSTARRGRRGGGGFRGCITGADQRTLYASLAPYPLPCAVTRTAAYSSLSSGRAAVTLSTGA